MRAPSVAPAAGSVPGRGALVVGVPRSGTTLLKALLDGHPWIWPLPGESFASAVCTARDPVADFFRRSNIPARLAGDAQRAALERGLRARVHGPLPPAGFLRHLLEVYAGIVPPAATARVWLEKTPRNDRVLDSVLSAFGPATRGVIVVRDPRASMASMARRWDRRTPRQVLSGCRRWMLSDRLRRAALARHPGAVHVVRYEDLVRDTEAQMRAVAAHLELPWDDVLVRTTRTGDAWGGNSSFGERYRGISDESLERWRGTLPEQAVELIERLLGPRMLAHGYVPERVDPARFDPRRAWNERVAALRTRRNLRRFAVGR